MNNRLLLGLTCCLLFLSRCGSLEMVPRGERYVDKVTPGNKMVGGGANYLVEKTPDQLYQIKRFYYETRQLISTHTYKDKAWSILDGPSSTWFDNGVLWTKGNYKNGQKTGVWKESRIEDFGASGYSEGEYSENLRTGVWIRYDSLGQKAKEIQYVEGQATQSKSFLPDGTILVDTIYNLVAEDGLQIAPQYPCDPNYKDMGKDCGEKSLMKYLSTHMRYPSRARNLYITGTAYISFVVDKEGKVQNVRVLQGICDDIKAECYRIMANMPDWIPGSAQGKPVKVMYTLPIKFRLE